MISLVYIAIILGCIIGAFIGNFAPMISYTYSEYLAIAIVAALDTIKYLLDQNAMVILMSHLGRPKGEVKKEFSLLPVGQDNTICLRPQSPEFFHPLFFQ